MPLLKVSGINVGIEEDPHPLLRDVGFTVDGGEIVGLVGESGSGKTMASLALMGLLPAGVELRDGSIRLEDRELIDENLRVHRTARDFTMIFQHPSSALNPTMRVGRQIARVLSVVQNVGRRAAAKQAVDMLGDVGIAGADKVARSYPHQLSGGMCQRVMIAMAFACRSKLLIADEPTTALDVTIQAQIFDLIKQLSRETGSGVLFITHDLGAVAELCDRTVVLFGGQVMESAPTPRLFAAPEHPYTQYLFEAVERSVDPRSPEIGADHTLSGCRFMHRCPQRFEACDRIPPMLDLGDGRSASCFLHSEENRVAS